MSAGDYPTAGLRTGKALAISSKARCRARWPLPVPSKLARYLFSDGGWLIFYCARAKKILRALFTLPPGGGLVDPQLRASNDINGPSKLARCLFRDGG